MDSAIVNLKRRQVAALQIAPLGGHTIFFRKAPYGGRNLWLGFYKHWPPTEAVANFC
jgi:hypothetical protein